MIFLVVIVFAMNIEHKALIQFKNSTKLQHWQCRRQNEMHLIIGNWNRESCYIECEDCRKWPIFETVLFFFATINAAINFVLIEWLSNSEDYKFNRSESESGTTAGLGIRFFSFLFYKEKLIEQVRYVSGNNTTNLFYFSENAICTIVYLILMFFFVCVCCLSETHVHSAASERNRHKHAHIHFVMRLQVTTQMIHSALRKKQLCVMVIVHDLRLFRIPYFVFCFLFSRSCQSVFLMLFSHIIIILCRAKRISK